ncbi:hypothetical protein VTO42DRAFT_61 [Malbranchea cinnamomea]
MTSAQKAVYCTLLMSDSYLPGAMVLAHSLRDHGTKAKLVALVTLDSLEPSTVDELKTIYDEVIPINRITNINPTNLYLMNRPDLIATFSKIELWRQTQFKQIVYIDADIVALRAPDELLSLDTHFAAAPDIGWPDCFNTGLMVLRPNLQDYYSLLALAQRGISFDGADQGLLNMHFRDWQRLSFTYNCTPSGHYQYVPAFRHFQNTISLVHYIGQQKPWQLPRKVEQVGTPYNQLLGHWWATYDRHFRPEVVTANSQQTSGKSQAGQPYPLTKETPFSQSKQQADVSNKPDAPVRSASRFYEPPDDGHASNLPTSTSPVSVAEEKGFYSSTTRNSTATSEPITISEMQPTQIKQTPLMRTLERSNGPSEIPEAAQGLDGIAVSKLIQTQSLHVPLPPKSESLAQDHTPLKPLVPIISAVPQYVHGEEHVSVYRRSYHEVDSPVAVAEAGSQTSSSISSSPILKPHLIDSQKSASTKKPPIIEQQKSALGSTVERPFSPPRSRWDASREPPPVDSKPEGLCLPSHMSTMSKDTQLFQPPKSYPEAPKNMYYEVPHKAPPAKPPRLFPWEAHAPRPSRVFTEDLLDKSNIPESTSATGNRSSIATGSSKRLRESYVRSNAWDEDPEIQRYMRALQKARKESVEVIAGPLTQISNERRQSTRVTDFPSSEERPSLPVTPAPVTRRFDWEDAQGGWAGELPADEGAPNQADWKPRGTSRGAATASIDVS